MADGGLLYRRINGKESMPHCLIVQENDLPVSNHSLQYRNNLIALS